MYHCKNEQERNPRKLRHFGYSLIHLTSHHENLAFHEYLNGILKKVRSSRDKKTVEDVH